VHSLSFGGQGQCKTHTNIKFRITLTRTSCISA
jgi:hypothetical protein